MQDHGFSPESSNRVFRFSLWERAVAERRPLGALFYDDATLPAELTRLRAALEAARRLADLARRGRGGEVGPRPDGGRGESGDEEAGGSAARLLVADTGPAALYGALPPGRGDAVLVNVGNGHTVCAVARRAAVSPASSSTTRAGSTARVSSSDCGASSPDA